MDKDDRSAPGMKPSTEDVMMPCFAEGCCVESTHHRSVWVNEHHLRVEYYCGDHAPVDSTPFEDDDEAPR